MDKITHQVRLANWQKIIEQCNNRPQGTTVKQWVKDNGINEKTYYYWLRRVRREVYSQMTPELPAVSSSEPPAVTFAEIPVPVQPDPMPVPFQADAMICIGSMTVGIANSISDNLLEKLLEVAGHAR